VRRPSPVVELDGPDRNGCQEIRRRSGLHAEQDVQDSIRRLQGVREAHTQGDQEGFGKTERGRPMNETKYHVWALLPDKGPKGSGWSLITPEVTEEQANVYVETLACPVRMERAVWGMSLEGVFGSPWTFWTRPTSTQRGCRLPEKS